MIGTETPKKAPTGTAPLLVPASDVPTRPDTFYKAKIQVGIILSLIGLLVLLIGTRPSLFGLDRSPVIGFVQLAVMIVGLAVICIGGYISLNSLWRDHPRSIAADIGLRLVSTGFLIVVFCAMADVFGLGSHPLPGVPFFGMLQARGVIIGQAFIAVGFLLMVPYSRPKFLHPVKR